jgi:hypothetical protein
MLINFSLALIDQSLAGVASAQGPGGRMSDIVEIANRRTRATQMRDEIRQISDKVRRATSPASFAPHGHPMR